jgi:hypothetical protein
VDFLPGQAAAPFIEFSAVEPPQVQSITPAVLPPNVPVLMEPSNDLLSDNGLNVTVDGTDLFADRSSILDGEEEDPGTTTAYSWRIDHSTGDHRFKRAFSNPFPG